MEQHPVPQNVTTFQFRLIGDMTIKQFGYLAGGLIIGYICYKLPLPFIFTWPMAMFSGLLGFGLAFVPVEERPMDVWVISFIKNVYSPTQYIWQKTKPKPAASSEAVLQHKPIIPIVQPEHSQSVHHPDPKPTFLSTVQRLFGLQSKNKVAVSQFSQSAPQGTPNASPVASAQRAAASSIPAHPLNHHHVVSSRQSGDPLVWMDDQLQSFGFTRSAKLPTQPATIKGPLIGKPAQQPPAQPTEPPHPQTTVAHPAPASAPSQSTIHALEQTIEKLEKELADKTVAQGRIVELQQQITEVLANRQRLEAELATLRQKVASQPQSASSPLRTAPTVGSGMPAAPTIRVIAAEGAMKAGIPRLTTFPNIISGIVKDNLGNLLWGILITVRDKDEVPLRALKTNRLGQFAASTPLPNGTYLVEIEDPRSGNLFDKVQITLNGTVLPAIEVVSKSKKQMDRDKLAREIFGDTHM